MVLTYVHFLLQFVLEFVGLSLITVLTSCAASEPILPDLMVVTVNSQ